MKILQLNCVYGNGSTGKIVKDIKEYLEDTGDEVSVAYGNGNIVNAPHVYKFCHRWEVRLNSLLVKAGRLHYSGLFWPTKRIIRYIEKENPDIVHVHCLNGYCADLYHVLDYLASSGRRTVVTHHAEFYYTGSCSHAYECLKWIDGSCGPCPHRREATASPWIDNTRQGWRKMKETFSKFGKHQLRFTAVSPWVKERSLKSPIVNRWPVDVVMNGVDTNIFYPRELTSTNPFKELITDNAILHVTASFSLKEGNDNKGGRYVCALAQRMPKHQFLIACNYHDTLIGLPSNVHIMGRIQSQQILAELYSSVKVTLITSQRETYSMVTAESLCCGTPVVGFEAGGPESIALKEYACFVSYGNVDALLSAVENISPKKNDSYNIAKKAQEIYAREIMGNNYRRVYQHLIQDKIIMSTYV